MKQCYLHEHYAILHEGFPILVIINIRVGISTFKDLLNFLIFLGL